MKRVAILGSTGSIGISALKVLRAMPESFKVEALSTFGNTKLLSKQIDEFKPKAVAVVNQNKVSDLKNRNSLSGVKVYSTQAGLDILADLEKVDIVIMAISGSAALNPLLVAIKARKKICLANKESLVMAGEIVMQSALKHKATIIPVDSEHSAIFQCLASNKMTQKMSKIYLTGSGGPLKDLPKSKFKSIRRSKVLKHPRWSMGPKITVDSATMMNKGLEVIEAKHLFGISASRIKVLIHPEAVIHSMVEFTDGAIMAQMGVADMKLPIQYALTYPDRADIALETLDFYKISNLNFSKPDFNKFPCLELANIACKLGGTYPAVLNAADEVVVDAYLKEKVGFLDIPKFIEKTLMAHNSEADPHLNDIANADLWAREKMKEFIR